MWPKALEPRSMASWPVIFERVSGHRGYSYDAYQFNKRISYKASTDLNSQQYHNSNRGIVPLSIMAEIGFEDWDYISLEGTSRIWKTFLKLLKAGRTSLKLQVPCRGPLIHLLMSQCNHCGEHFECTTDDLLSHTEYQSVWLGWTASQEPWYKSWNNASFGQVGWGSVTICDDP